MWRGHHNLFVRGPEEANTTPGREVDAPPGREVDAPPAPEVDAPPGPEVDAPPGPEVDAPPAPEVDAPLGPEEAAARRANDPRYADYPYDNVYDINDPAAPWWGKRVDFSKLSQSKSSNSGIQEFLNCLYESEVLCLSNCSPNLDLRTVLQELVPEQQERLEKLKQNFGNVQLGNITIDMVLGGMRGMTGLLWETSSLDQEGGIRFRGFSIPDCQKLLPAAKPGGEPLPEGLLWLLLTGKVPNKEQVDALSADLRRRASVPDHVYKIIDALPVNAHPMTQFCTGVMALQVQSKFQNAYEKGIHESKFWEVTFEDCLSLIAQVPLVAAYVYRRMYKNGQHIQPDDSLDYGGNFSHMLGFDSPEMLELMRLYITIHADHEGGNVGTHTARLVGSALSDPYRSFAAALNGLAGPLHGLANQSKLYEVVPPVLTELGKVKNSWPKVDALLSHSIEARYLPVVFGVSRCIGICSQLIWDRALALPLEGPKSVTIEWLENQCKKVKGG